MVRIKGWPLNVPKVHIKGRLLSTPQADGTHVVRSWPRGMPKKTTPARQQSIANFAVAAKWASDPVPQEYERAVKITKATGYLPRDALMSAMYGRLTYAWTKNGELIIGKRVVSEQIQLFLDQITTTPGSLLLRTADQWVGLEPGAAGTVLTAHGPGNLPTYSAAGGGGSSTGAVSGPTGQVGGFSGDGSASDGMVIRPFTDLKLTKLYSFVEPPAGATYAANICKVTGYPSTPTLASVNTYTTTVPATVVTGLQVMLETTIGTGLTLAAGDDWWLGFTRTDGGDTTPVGLAYIASGGGRWAEQLQVLGQAQVHQKTPSVGHTVDRWVAGVSMGQAIEASS